MKDSKVKGKTNRKQKEPNTHLPLNRGASVGIYTASREKSQKAIDNNTLKKPIQI